MSEWDFTWGLTGEDLIYAQSTGFAPGEEPYDYDENEEDEFCYECSRCCRVYSEEYYFTHSCCPHCGEPFELWDDDEILRND